MRFGLSYLEQAELTDGSPVSLRLVRATDKPLLLEAWDRVSPESKYRRFLGVKPRLSTDELRYLTEIDQLDHLAIGAIDAANRGLGIARSIRTERDDVAELAVLVVDAVQRKGLGRLLIARIAAAAYERGIRFFTCETLGSNLPMQALLRGAGRISAGRVEITISIEQLALL